jgi:pimeloyl-ACP methyl ester carboxylesterase
MNNAGGRVAIMAQGKFGNIRCLLITSQIIVDKLLTNNLYFAQTAVSREDIDDMSGSETPVSVVLVHGAWADGSSWARVIELLQAKGLKVLAAPIPLTSLPDDIAALERTLDRTAGPVVLVAHAYAGAVIGASTNNRVRSLVFIAGLAPDEGETVAEVFYREKPHVAAPRLAPDAHGLIWLPDQAFGAAFSQNSSAQQAAIFAATQRPIALACIQQKSPTPAWKTKPSWYLVAQEDRMIAPATQLFMAQRMGAQIRSEPVDHLPLVTGPETVVEVILQAAVGLAG